MQEVNLTSVYLCCKHVIPYMQRQGKGSIINTASFVAVLGAATSQISYTASKGGVLAMSRELGVQFAREGIRVNALCPGPVNTPLLQELFAKDPERAARRLVHVPMGRFAEPEEIAAAVAFLASDDCVVHHRVAVPGGRRHLRRLRDTPVSGGSQGDPVSMPERRPMRWLPAAAPADRDQHLQRAGPVGGLGRAGVLLPRRYAERVGGGGRDAGAAAAGAGHRGRRSAGWTG